MIGIREHPILVFSLAAFLASYGCETTADYPMMQNFITTNSWPSAALASIVAKTENYLWKGDVTSELPSSTLG